ncbi:unnamed protein product [Adineta ricciae]|uniref:Disease resistance R13L4/SHOC-2-like LRR domain-containing protein n=1 Tax=Adineta ricciae TaxID=249248 RepID=A0A815T716_ADIRI|nr:unnamed protein product [Adineta ricciae]CAF1500779.1 unnamed protein product [Adineta ricciae]
MTMVINILLTLLLLSSWSLADTSSSTLDCSSFQSDRDIIRSFQFRILINPPESAISVDDTYAMVNNQGQVTELNFWGKSVPSSIYCLKNLNSLNIQYTSNFSISTEIVRLSGVLRKLTLSNISQLRSLPIELFKVLSLQSLTISNSGLETLPEEIGQLSSLATLDLTYNRLRSLPNSLGTMWPLIELRLDKNPLTSLDALTGSPRLSQLSASNCAIDHLPTNLTRLRSFNLYGNRLTSLNTLDSLGVYGAESMKFGKNNITSLPATVNRLQVVQNLDLSNNLLTELPMWMYNVQIKEINLRQNKFDEKEWDWIVGMFRISNTTVNF